jgi:cytochrome c oxidase assembly protein subunit 15
MRSAYPLFVVILIQGAIGYTQYELGIPAWLVILHIAGATAVTVALTWFQLRLLHLTSAIPTGNRAGSGRGGLEAPGAAEPGDPEHAGATAP